MEKILLDLVKFVGVPAAILFIILMILYKYGGNILDFFKKKPKQDKVLEKLFDIIDDAKKREDEAKEREFGYRETIAEQNKINEKIVATNEVLTNTNKELFNEMRSEVCNIKEDMNEVKEGLKKMHDNVLEIKFCNKK
ncbi:hypothetical protein ACSW9O_15925 (plasmid) [Clostridium perfringens]|nr:hypothetical protein [Clostridium perfringens]